MSNSFRVKLKGVTKDNKDGINRQEIIQKLKVGDKVNFIAEPTNPYDRWAVSVEQA